MRRIPPRPTVDNWELPLVLDRQFYVDSLVSTHKQLLLKSPMGDEYGDRVDVLFKGVRAVKLAFDLPTLKVRLPTDRELAGVIAECGEETIGGGRPAMQAYVISGGRADGYVVAVTAFLVKNQEHGANTSQLLWDVYRTPPPSTIYRLV
ncbi:hypothetical protein [Actinomadura violacea]|uniref:Uncharacterized protein n=1 Tax=Actinomadura violacea TaxID=2819934 RepID=A0ABS3RN30_9ACTN|nr:hypothetical protein [Actinomadura violacea]MBO2458111.1 hypothetical protein [Actinomadura violacea]